MIRFLLTFGAILALPSVSSANPVQKEMCHIYQKYYGLTERKHVDWEKDCFNKKGDLMRDVFGPLMTDTLKDGHSSISYRDKTVSYEPDIHPYLEQMLQTVTPRYIDYTVDIEDNAYLAYGELKSDSSIGYINTFNFEPETDLEDDYDYFAELVDNALDSLKTKRAIIIDARLNQGGQVPMAFYLAGRFYQGEAIQVARYRIRTPNGKLSHWLDGEVIGYQDHRADGGYVSGVFAEDGYLRKSGEYQYQKPVILLTSKLTASAAEFFTIAMKNQKHVTVIGTSTFGIFSGSDILTLSSDANYSTRLSTQDIEVYIDDQFTSLEGIGIKPDISDEISGSHVEKGFDSQLEKAISSLQ
ncbi:putative C-terminal processing peptidase [Vibrio nigripulchritudo SO65]|uniref:S41 family peptidase n=1 Tax=Vibrio nigripulchritudo TaxID=28173 RepID=UPI0003B19877|nr:S41 family peptidase [Vibrio nigripulchritudo]CCN35800.1 putative C-terminal processing peptidase [Vibrio nigripulchritudo AM115]CCN41865.1 putative C-terminal processing peptidase [Vibrio nigripulchritudo FTn2]CCN66342.1 putative C-terminal processing peptidase [Vibrio nigripulchritudo POn4]CCN74433.1 putative C-terminal processing peptidase [Vibrio nigripulchritudo SO65]